MRVEPESAPRGGASSPGFLGRLEELAARLLDRPGAVVLAFVVLFAAMAPGLGRLGLDNSPERFFVRDAEALERYRGFEFDFGRDRSVRLVLEGDGLWHREGLAWLAELELEAARLRGVIGAAGLYGRHRWHLDAWPPSDPAAFRDLVLADPLDREVGWVSADGSTVTVLAALYQLSPAQQQETLADLQALVAEAPAGIEGRLAGLPVVQQALDQALLDMAEIFFPVLAALAAVLLALVFRRFRDAARPLALVLLCQGTVFGAVGWSGAAVDLVTVVLVPLLFVVTLATAIHLQVHFLAERQRGGSSAAAARATLRAKLWAVVWTGGTTAIGFGSLVLARVPAVRALGLWSLGAFLFMTAAAAIFFPALLALTAPGGGSATAVPFTAWSRRWGLRGAGAAVRRRGLTLTLFGLVAAIALTGLPRLRPEAGVLEYFERDHPVRSTLEDLTDRGLGVLAAELVLDRRAVDGAAGPVASSGAAEARFDRPEDLETLERLAARLRAEPPLLGVFGAGDLVAGVGRFLPAVDGESPARDASLARIRATPELDRMWRFFVTADGARTRLTLMVPMAGYGALEPVFESARGAARAAFPDARVEITGRYPMVLAARHTLLGTMLASLALTMLCVAAIFRGVLGSAALALRALVPNLWPVALVLGIMGWAGVGVDSTTVMIAAAALGLAVDDTFHTLGSFRRRVATAAAPQAAREALGELAGAHLVTSLVLAAGFAACAASSFVPMARFGALTALAVLAALVADLWLVPALLAGASDEEVARLSSTGG